MCFKIYYFISVVIILWFCLTAHLKVNNWELICSIPELPALFAKALMHGGWCQSLKNLEFKCINLSIIHPSIHHSSPSSVSPFICEWDWRNKWRREPRGTWSTHSTVTWHEEKRQGCVTGALHFPSPYPICYSVTHT